MQNNLWGWMLLIGAMTLSKSASSQQDKWYLPPYFYDMSTAVPSPNPATSSFFVIAQSIEDNNGNTIFYIDGKSVYKGDGTYAFNLPAFRHSMGDYDNTGTNMIIVPVPQTCNKYYVFYSLFRSGGGESALYYVIVDMSSGSPGLDPAGLEPASFPLSGTNPKHISFTAAFALSKPTSNSQERFLFALKGDNITKYFITSAGITEIGSLYTLPSGTNYYPHKVELSPDQKYLSIVPLISNGTIYQVQLDGSYNAIATTSVNLGYKVVGLQYDPTSTYLFISGANGIQWHTAENLPTGAFTTVPGSSALTATALELSKTGNIYGIDNSQTLCYISTSMPSPSVTTTGITVNQIFTSFPGGSIRSLPRQIDGQDYSDFGNVKKPRADFSLAGATANDAPTAALARNAYTCNDILFGNTGTPHQYILKVQSCDASGNVISGAGYLDYSSGLRNFTPGFMDFKALPVAGGGTNTWLADPAHIGYYKVTLVTNNTCGELSVPKISYLKLNAPPSPATINLSINNGITGTPCRNQTSASTCLAGRYSASYNLGTPGSTFGTNNITQYQRKLEKVNCSTGDVIEILYNESPVTPPNPSGLLMGLSLNSLMTLPGDPPYFSDKTNVCYKFTVTVYNACSSNSDWTYFMIDPDLSHISEFIPYSDLSEDLNVYPNPITDELNIEFNSSGQEQHKVELYDINGRMLEIHNIKTQKGINKINLSFSNYSSGMYFYKFYYPDGRYNTGKITKQ